MTLTRNRRRSAIVAIAFALLAGACSSDAPTAEQPMALGTGSPTETPAPASNGDVCATVPSLEVITTQLGEPVTGSRRLERGPGTELCEVNGDGVASVQFTRSSPSSREQVAATAAELGYPATDLNDPALPGAITYAGAVTVFVGDVEYTVQAVTLDTVAEPGSPLAAQRSATLLAAWLQLLGVPL